MLNFIWVGVDICDCSIYNDNLEARTGELCDDSGFSAREGGEDGEGEDIVSGFNCEGVTFSDAFDYNGVIISEVLFYRKL